MFHHTARKQSPAGVVFASDPLIISMSAGRNVVYSSAGESHVILLSEAASVDVSDLAEAWTSPLALPSGSDWLERVEDWSGDCPRRIYTKLPKNIPGQNVDRYSTFVIPGRTSRQNLELRDGSDMFAGRFLSPQGNPFLTTRTHTGRIILKETELAPLYFLEDGETPEEIAVYTCTAVAPLFLKGTKLLGGTTSGQGVYTVDLQKIRRAVFDNYGALLSEFCIKKGGRTAAEIFIEAAQPSKSRHLLKFRNSFGVFEVVELTGELTNETTFAEAGAYSRFRGDLFRFERERNRPELESSLKVETGPKKKRELLHLLDALGSDEVWLLGYGLTPLRVIPEAKGVSIPERQEEPQSFDLTLRPVYDEPAIMPEISKSNASYLRKIFTNVFDNKFT